MRRTKSLYLGPLGSRDGNPCRFHLVSLPHLYTDPSPPATKEIVEAYNRLRSNILLLYDLRGALLQCDYELHAARARMELFAAERVRISRLPLLSTLLLCKSFWNMIRWYSSIIHRGRNVSSQLLI